MRKDIMLPALALAGGAAGFFLRLRQLASAYRAEEQLFVRGAPATYALLLLTALLALAFALLLWKKTEGLDDFLPAFGSPCRNQMTALAAAGLLLMAAAALGLWDSLNRIQLWQLEPEAYQLSELGARLLTALLCLPAGDALLMMGRMAYRGELNRQGCFLAPFPAFAGLLWLFSIHLRHGTEPVLMKYGFTLFAALLFTLAHYDFAGFLYGRPHPRRAAFCALLGTVLGLTSLADVPAGLYDAATPGGELFNAAAMLAFALSALAFTRALLAGPWPERMPPPEEDTFEHDPRL